MPTFVNIASQTVSSPVSTVTFSGIPSTYTDLYVLASLRTDNPNIGSNVYITLNGLTTAIYSRTVLYSDYVNPTSSYRTSNTNQFILNQVNADTSTTNTFTALSFYFPNYTKSATRPVYIDFMAENNATTSNGVALAGLFRDNSTISSISFAAVSANFVANSSFYLYGIKNS